MQQAKSWVVTVGDKHFNMITPEGADAVEALAAVRQILATTDPATISVKPFEVNKPLDLPEL